MASEMKNDTELSREGDGQSEAGSEISHGDDSAAGPCKPRSVEPQGTSSATGAAAAPSFNDGIDADSALGSPAKETEEEAKIRHIMANRKSAKESRERKKQKMVQLSASADALATANRSLRRVNSELRDGVQDLKQQLRLKMAVLQQQSGGLMTQETVRAHSFLGGGIPMAEILRPPGQHNFSPHQAMASSSAMRGAAKTKDSILLSTQGFETFAADAIADLKHAPSPSCNAAARQDTSASAQTSSDNDSVDTEPAVPAKREETEEEKRMRRVMANRKSAKESRIRRRAKIAKLSAEIDQLTAGNRLLRTTNSELTAGVRDMKEQLRQTLAVAQQRQGHMLTPEVVNASFSNITPHDFMQGHRPPARQQQQPNFSQTNPLHEAVNEDFDSVLGGRLMDDLEE